MADSEGHANEGLVEAALIAASGDHRAFEELVRKHEGHVLANCRYLTRSDVDAEDLAQEVFVKAFFGLRTLTNAARFTPWLRRIKVNHCLNFIRKRRGAVIVELDSDEVHSHASLSTPAGHAGDLDEQMRRREIRRVLAAMPDKLRIPLVLCDMDGLTYEEAASELDIGLSALKMRLKRARELFRERYDQRIRRAHG